MYCILVIFFFFFKQKTAYEMSVSDWSSDVCSSDLDIAAGGLSVALHRFGRDLQPGQCFQLLAPLREAAVATYQRHHASHSRGTFRVHYIQLLIPRALPLVAR